jgi:hypothetical protein
VPPGQYWFTGGALAAFIALVVVGYGWYGAVMSEFELANNKTQSAASAERKARTELVKDRLVSAISDGSDLVQGLPNETDDFMVERAVEAWAHRTRDLIDAAYGSDEAALFMDNSGYAFYSDGTARRSLGNFVDGRIRRLSELLRRADSMTVREEFDPARLDRGHTSGSQAPGLSAEQ